MRFLRMLTNALLGRRAGAAYLTVVVLQLNPHVPLRVEHDVAAGSSRSALFYGIHLAVVFYLLMVGARVRSARRAVAGLGERPRARLAVRRRRRRRLVLMWLNVDGLSRRSTRRAARRMTAGAAATTATALVLLGLAAAHYSFGRRGSRVGAALLAIAVVRIAGAAGRRARARRSRRRRPA